MIGHLDIHWQTLRIDWPLLLSATAVAITLFGATAVGVQMRRTRRRVLGSLERVFEQLDLLRLEALEAGDATAGAAATPPRAAAQPSQAAPRPHAPPPQAMPAPVLAPASLADYQSAARLAAHGAPLAEIAERCGVVAAEAKVLMALQGRRGQAVRRGAR